MIGDWPVPVVFVPLARSFAPFNVHCINQEPGTGLLILGGVAMLLQKLLHAPACFQCWGSYVILLLTFKYLALHRFSLHT